ncbi:hypothetical protein FJV46_10130 [Arthrobacter agilis]|uniref:hypothetical protein n=1 Tax=Arthrobacter agilis TaxID=37921 RepID=UPI000B354F0A|nr:hypothetical protein [Arthrobacter agilis]OUM43764.1 hypothetical protein B8W74_06380 [Arthrobacter agilis]PPB46650.1 hypothetical protein CI784_05010 [Arthrobacter agilis]TPV25007.1 hypothetical protein FJV46_10130 [Arthrobacter agilis]WDF33794.1 hypothetical protein PTW37_02375 [Arthrobacter agilis]VDR31188.1 Uncharacterised protein [Arthrobacter agilis]
MKSAPKNRAQRAVAAGALLVVLPISGCNLIAEQSTTTQYAASDGIVKDLGPVLMRNILVVGTEDDEAGRLVGTVFNTSDDPVDLSVSAGGGATRISIEGQGQIRFEDESGDDATLEGIDDIPGSLIDIDFEVDGEQATFQVPVLDGTLQEYREFVPGGYTPRPSEPAATEEAAEGE